MIDSRIELLQQGEQKSGPILYWMSREQRANDNWALLFAQELAQKNKSYVQVVFSLNNSFLDAGRRQFGFLLKGLAVDTTILAEHNIPFQLLTGKPEETIPAFLAENSFSAIVTDFDPMKTKRLWKNKVAAKIFIPFYEVDAHNIVPCKFVSPKEEFAAYTIRPKIQKLLSQFLDEFPKLQRQDGVPPDLFQVIDWKQISESLKLDEKVKEVDWIIPGETAAIESLNIFLDAKLLHYDSIETTRCCLVSLIYPPTYTLDIYPRKELLLK